MPLASSKVALVVLVVLTWAIIAYLVSRHILHWSRPQLQKSYVRICLLLPIFSLVSLIVYLIPHYGVFFEAVRALTEAYALYAFFAALVIYAGGERVVATMYESPEFETEYHHTLFCGAVTWKHSRGAQVLRWHKQCCAQLMVAKPACALAIAMCESLGDATHPTMKAVILIFAVLGVLSMMLLMRTLLAVYLMIKPALGGMQALKKFTVVKLIVFITITQGMVVNMVVAANGIAPKPDETASEAGARLVSVLAIVEMLIFAFIFMLTFNYKDFSVVSLSHSFKTGTLMPHGHGYDSSSMPDAAAIPPAAAAAGGVVKPSPDQHDSSWRGVPVHSSGASDIWSALRDIFTLTDYFTAPIEEYDSEPLVPASAAA